MLCPLQETIIDIRTQTCVSDFRLYDYALSEEERLAL